MAARAAAGAAGCRPCGVLDAYATPSNAPRARRRSPQVDLVLTTVEGADPARAFQQMWAGNDPFTELVCPAGKGHSRHRLAGTTAGTAAGVGTGLWARNGACLHKPQLATLVRPSSNHDFTGSPARRERPAHAVRPRAGPHSRDRRRHAERLCERGRVLCAWRQRHYVDTERHRPDGPRAWCRPIGRNTGHLSRTPGTPRSFVN